MLQGGGDRLRSVSLMAAGDDRPPRRRWRRPSPAQGTSAGHSWPLSATLDVIYNLLLVASYREGDLGVAYPIARGSSPMLVTLGAAVTAGERLGGSTLLGIGLISAGILGLAWERGRGASNRGIGPALATGLMIAAYTVVDGLGARRSGDPRSYAAWLFLLFGPPMVPILAARRGWPATFRADAEMARAAMGGAVSMLAYAIVIWAASIAPMGEVSALRETSVVFAVLFGWMFLGEPLRAQRLASCLVVAAGAAWLPDIGTEAAG